jgi:hypothetical protein
MSNPALQIIPGEAIASGPAWSRMRRRLVQADVAALADKLDEMINTLSV